MTYVTTITVSEARASLPEVLDRVGSGEEVTITRHGAPAAVMVRPDALRVRRAESAFAGANEIAALLETGRSTPLSRPLSADRAETLVAEVRKGRYRS